MGANDQVHGWHEEKGRADPFVLAEAASPLALDQRRAEPGRNAAVRRHRNHAEPRRRHRGEPDRDRARGPAAAATPESASGWRRSDEHTSELQSLMRISYAVFCLHKTNNIN